MVGRADRGGLESSAQGWCGLIWIRNLLLGATVLGVGAFLGRFVSVAIAAWWLAACFAAYLLYQTWNIDRLNFWAALPRLRTLPVGSGDWSVVFERLTRAAKVEHESHGELTQELERIHAAVDRLPDGLIVLDKYDHIEWGNKAAEELFGIFGRRRPIHHFIRHPDFTAILEARDYSKRLIVSLPSRPTRLFELRIHVGEEDQKLLIARDVTEQAKLDAMRRDFVANVSHEIRTPVTVIGGFAETLLSLDLDVDARREYLESILKQSSTMQRLVEDLLTLSSLETSSQPPAEERVDLHVLLQALVGEAKTLSAGRHEISLTLDIPRFVTAAPAEIESAVRNLLTNAIRYTPEGGRISVDWRFREDEGRLTVRDTGIGIEEEHMPRLTERFYRVDRSRSRSNGGTGLGLAIVKHIMQRHQGALQIDSKFGQGSTFTLRMPKQRLTPADAATESQPA